MRIDKRLNRGIIYVTNKYYPYQEWRRDKAL